MCEEPVNKLACRWRKPRMPHVVNIAIAPYGWSALLKLPCSVIELQAAPSLFPLWFLRRPSTSLNGLRCQSTLTRTDCFVTKKLYNESVWVPQSVCDVFPDVFSLSSSKVWWWWLTIFDWLWSDFFTPYFCIFTLRSLFWSSMLLNVWRSSVTIEFIFIQIYIFFVSFPLFFQFPLC